MGSIAFLLALPFLVQGVCMFVDEFYFHRRRGLGLWERVGHPLDTVTVIACLSLTIFFPATVGLLKLYAGLAAFSCLFVTKDEFVHAKECAPTEHWLHAVLFILHPLVLACGAIAWIMAQGQSLMPGFLRPVFGSGLAGAAGSFKAVLWGQWVMLVGFLVHQIVFWNFRKFRPSESVMPGRGYKTIHGADGRGP